DALRAVDRAIEIFREAGDHHAEGRALIKKSTILHEKGDAEAALPLLDRAASLVDPGREPRLLLMVKQNLVLFLSELGEAMEARKLLPEARKLAMEVGGGLDRLRVLWIEGTVHRKLGQAGLAEAALRRSMTGFTEAGIGFDAALAALELAVLYLETGRRSDARNLAVEMIPIFAANDVHREALAALVVVQKAMEQDAVNLGLVQEAASFLRRARRNPALRFEPPT
ncbi:MAG TPA: hypothetical protein VLF66_13880, partial [Thermoanaerobaculia bacterium]|nr:hypothetical protein [Thermoanaerobaculia bacterium]